MEKTKYQLVSDSPKRKGMLRETISPTALSYMGIPKIFQGKFISDYCFKAPELRNLIVKYVSYPEQMLADNINIVFSGCNGNGKTLLASIILQELYARYYSGYFINFQEILKRTYTKQDTSMIYESEFLVIDELGAEIDSAKGSEKSLLEEILKQRESNSRPTIICTNLKIDEITKRYGYTVGSMLKQAIVITLTSPDRRKEIFKQKEALKRLVGFGK